MATYRRCRGDHLVMAEAMPLQQHYEVRTTLPIAHCLSSEYFMDVRGRLRAGDRLNIVRYENDTFERVIEFIEGVRIVAVDNAGVELAAAFAPVTLAKDGEKGIVVARGFAGKFVVRIDGATHKTFNTLIEANEAAEMLGLETGRPVELLDLKKKAA